MKKLKWIIIVLSGALLMGSCSEYLEKTPEAEVTEEDIFGNFESFQGFVEKMYYDVVDYGYLALNQTPNVGGEAHSTFWVQSSAHANNGIYNMWYRETGANTNQTYWNNTNSNTNTGIWNGGWRSIRIANMVLEKLPLLVDATQEEIDLIAGQAYFFRAFLYWELAKGVGGLPYIDKLLTPADDLDMPRLTFQETAERIVEDFDRAIELLPADWDDTSVGGTFQGFNTGRATKGAAMAFKAKTLLFAGSPLMEKYSGGAAYEYNQEYMERAAAAAWEVIKFAEETGTYSLVDWADYKGNFTKNDGTYPWTSETMWMRMDWSNPSKGQNPWNTKFGRTYSPSRLEGNAQIETVNQVYVDKFEMADGSRYKLEYDSDDTKRWENRDPRFKENIIVDRDKWGFANQTVFKLYIGAGSDRASSTPTCYVNKKYWALGANKFDKLYQDVCYRMPHMRLADVYLIYAEAVTVAYGPTGRAPGANLTAVDAINVIRNRAGMPSTSVALAAANGYDSFMDLVRNERNVELCFEGHYWYDTRRWYIAHLQENKEIWDMQFPQNWSTFTRVKVFDRVFDDPKHYWMPLPRSQSQLFEGFYQNPGW